MLEVEKVTANPSPKGKKNIGGKKTAERVWELMKPVADELGLELWDVRYEKEGASWYLKLIIDKDGGVNINDCENMSRRADKLLDEADPIEDSYRLQVSSPGIERELTRDWHFEKCMGEYVLVRFIRPVEEQNGERDFEGVLAGYDNGEVSIVLKEAEEDSDGVEMCFNVSETAYIRLADDFEKIGDFDDAEDD
ncbi:MAG: ribosome maturation factor RimP [Ruminococcaceae bacterium]|nr:ribosome maturation factor RimP [Oscillospiraceae bacterium]